MQTILETHSLANASLQELMREMLLRLGEDPERDGLRQTPERMEVSCIQKMGLRRTLWSVNQMHLIADSATHNGPLSSALARTFRGKLCDVTLRNRGVAIFEKDQVIYDAGDENQTFFFLQKGFVKVGSITEDGHELIYDVRKAGDIVGELCASGQQRQDRAVALERTEVIAVPLDEILEIVQTNRDLLQELVQMFCESLSDAYDQLNTLASSDTVHRLVRVLLRLGTQLGHTSGQRTELSAYLTQEEISQMVVARRERVSTAMNLLRNRGMVDYSHRGYLVLDLKALQNYAD